LKVRARLALSIVTPMEEPMADTMTLPCLALSLILILISGCDHVFHAGTLDCSNGAPCPSEYVCQAGQCRPGPNAPNACVSAGGHCAAYPGSCPCGQWAEAYSSSCGGADGVIGCCVPTGGQGCAPDMGATSCAQVGEACHKDADCCSMVCPLNGQGASTCAAPADGGSGNKRLCTSAAGCPSDAPDCCCDEPGPNCVATCRPHSNIVCWGPTVGQPCTSACDGTDNCGAGQYCPDSCLTCPCSSSCQPQTFTCVLGQDQTCNASSTVSAILGHCQASSGGPIGSRCVCVPGATQDPQTGKCS
jgi:hypothetical protein